MERKGQFSYWEKMVDNGVEQRKERQKLSWTSLFNVADKGRDPSLDLRNCISKEGF
ncbi:hypothetical protein Csa_020060 [Cucumis sativus]|uniref:Uncharacterized protein n=1 Tax=Cucumis sativus TaxID=3659 RepID=A0A0A0LXC7_CUCSA|nr:hypothetical protein Csa_020060 [Cucumis sativus]